MFKCRLLEAKTQLKNLNAYISVASDSLKPDSYYVLFKERVVARVYKTGNDWFIWYEDSSHREKVYGEKPFTTALNKIEQECMNCVA